MAQDPQKIKVVLSGAQSTSVKHPSNSNKVTVVQQEQSSSVSKTAKTDINVGFMGVQGPAGNQLLGKGADGSIQYNRDGLVSGAKGFFYHPKATNLSITNNDLILGTGNVFVLSGIPSDSNAFLLKDANRNILRVDTDEKSIVLSEDGSNDYYVGLGLQDPQERVHIGGGNLRVDGDMLVSGNLLPLTSGTSSLGSQEYPFKDIYLQGNSIVFVDSESKITASSTGFSFQVITGGVTRTLFTATEKSVGIFQGDGSALTGVPYTGLRDAGAYLSLAVPSGASSVTVNYGKTLNYDPQIICSLNPPANSNEQYFTFVQDIGRSDCKAFFSDKVSGDGFILNCHVSPRNPAY
jgi:hypothetical protein